MRDPVNERYFADVRTDFRFSDDGEFILSGGLNNSLSSINLTSVGSAQTHDWQYRYGQARVLKGRLFAQFFLNQTHSGDNSYLLRTGDLIVDRSRTMAAQLQHGFDWGSRQRFTYGSTGSAPSRGPRARSTAATRTTICWSRPAPTCTPRRAWATGSTW